MLNINLLDSRRKDILKRQAMAAKFNAAAIGVAVLLALVSAGVGGYRLQLSSRLESIENELTTQITKVDDYEDVIIDSALVSDKLSTVEQILEGRDLVSQKLALFFKIFSNEKVQIREVGFGGTDNRADLEIGGAILNVSDYLDFSADIKRYTQEDNLETVVIDSLSRLEDGDYRFTYLVTFPSEEFVASER